MARAIPREDGMAALREWAADPSRAGRSVVATAVRWTLQTLASDAPGRSVEVRVPPWGAVQCIAGPRHTRGTPPNVVERSPAVWLALAVGDVTWDESTAGGGSAASGGRARSSHWRRRVRLSK